MDSSCKMNFLFELMIFSDYFESDVTSTWFGFWVIDVPIWKLSCSAVLKSLVGVVVYLHYSKCFQELERSIMLFKVRVGCILISCRYNFQERVNRK